MNALKLRLELMNKSSYWLRLNTLLFCVITWHLGSSYLCSLMFPLLAHAPTIEVLATLTPQQILSIQTIKSLSVFIIAPLSYLSLFEKNNQVIRLQWRHGYVRSMTTLFILMSSCCIVNVRLLQWNQAITLPYWLHAFEVWARTTEANLHVLLARITAFNSIQALGIGMCVLGVIPAVGEELLFRGLIQHFLQCAMHNRHAAIGISSLLFSALHFQFYALVPRWLLGGLLGYIYIWTEDLRFPIMGHLLSNVLGLLLIFIQRHYGLTNLFSPLQSLSAWLGALFVAVFATYSLRRQSRQYLYTM